MTLSLVTGVGAKGQVGEAAARRLAMRGDRTIIVSRSADDVQQRAAELRAEGLDVAGYACDLADVGAVSQLAERVSREQGRALDNLVNLAGGFASSGSFSDSDPAVVQRLWSINFLTAYLTTRAFLPLMTSGGGSIVFFASEVVLENTRTKGVAGYAAAKSAVVALMRSVADECRAVNVRANALAPASIRTSSNEASMGSDIRYVEREEVADTVAFLCSAAGEALSGQVIRLS
jgi:NAD(P)-dependent dehydrogenase (short-subunit alcohol dehydrogenase family)